MNWFYQVKIFSKRHFLSLTIVFREIWSYDWCLRYNEECFPLLLAFFLWNDLGLYFRDKILNDLQHLFKMMNELIIKKGYKITQFDDYLRTSPSVSLSKSADFFNVTISLGLMAFLSPLSTFSDRMFETVAKPSLAKIWANLLTREIVSPIPSIWADPCFLRTSLARNNPCWSLVSLLTLKTLVSLNLGPWLLIVVLNMLF